VILRSNGWEGPPPAEGDGLQTPDGRTFRVLDVAEGPGPGQYRMEVQECSVFLWTERAAP
jgi:hypothetical protein